MFKHRPALRVVILLAAGIILADIFSFSSIWIFSASFLSILLSFVSTRYLKDRIAGDIPVHMSIILLGLLLHTIQIEKYRSIELNPVVKDEVISISGTIDSEISKKGKRMSFIVSSDTIIRLNKTDLDKRRVMVVVYIEKWGECNYEYGNRIRVQGIIEQFPFQHNPGEFNYGKYLELNDIQGIVTVNGIKYVHAEKLSNRYSVGFWTYRVQRALYGIIDSLHTPEHAGFLKGIVFGYRADLPSDVKQSFMDTGTIHILAVSGSNVAFVTLLLFSVFGLFRLPKKYVTTAVLIGLLIYMLVTGSSASVVRATIMAIIILCGIMFERKNDIYNSISVAALILLLWNTNTLFDIGFQLSFASVVSIVYLYPRLVLLINKIPGKYEEIKALDFILKLFAVSLAAQLGTLPFTAYYFGRISVISLIANIPVVPISGLNTFIGFTEIVFYFIHPWIAGLYAAANDFLIWFLLGFVRRAASVPFAYIEIWHLNAAAIFIYYIFIVCLFNLDRMRIRVFLLILILLTVNFILYKSILMHADRKLTITILDVGQGDSFLVEFPDNKKMLVDTGPIYSRSDAGEKIILPFLNKQGIKKLDYLLITHLHSDHTGGIFSILRSVQVDTLILDADRGEDPAYSKIIEIAQAKGTPVISKFAGDQIFVDPDARVYVMHPDKNNFSNNLNNSSLVLRILYKRSSILLTGDAEKYSEVNIIKKYKKFIVSDILKIPHHGSDNGTSKELLSAVNPKKAVISVGIHNKFQHPSPVVIDRLAEFNVDMDRTDRTGAVILETDGNIWTKKER